MLEQLCERLYIQVRLVQAVEEQHFAQCKWIVSTVLSMKWAEMHDELVQTCLNQTMSEWVHIFVYLYK